MNFILIMKFYKIIFSIFLTTLCLNLFGQYGPTSAGGTEISENISLSYTIGEVINVQTSNSIYSNKIGILQPIKRLSSFVTIEEDLDFIIYPNPAVDFIKVPELPNHELNYSIYNVEGKVVLKGRVYDQIIELTGINEGTYFLHTTSEKGTWVKTFQKFNNR